MKKFLAPILALVLALAVGVAPVLAQNPPSQLVMGTTVTANVAAGQTYFQLTISGGNVTTFQFSNAVNAETVYVVFTQDSSGSRTVGLASNIMGTLTLNSTASSSTVVMFYYDVVTQDWYAVTLGHN